MIRHPGLTVFTVALILAGCATHRAEYEQQIKVCDVAETNGVLVTAVSACESAFTIADAHDYPAATVAEIALRLARLKRASGEFVAAESLARKSLAITSSEEGDTACHYIELSLNLAGQQRWGEAAAAIAATVDGDQAIAAGDVATIRRTANVIAGRLASDELAQHGEALGALSALTATDGDAVTLCDGRKQ